MDTATIDARTGAAEAPPGGWIAGQGTHAELPAAGGRSTRFWNERRRAQGRRLVPAQDS